MMRKPSRPSSGGGWSISPSARMTRRRVPLGALTWRMSGRFLPNSSLPFRRALPSRNSESRCAAMNSSQISYSASSRNDPGAAPGSAASKLISVSARSSPSWYSAKSPLMTWWPKMPSSSRKHWRSKERPCSERRVRPGRLASFSTASSATRAALPSYRSSRRRRLHSPLMYFEMTLLLREYTDTPLATGCRGDGGTKEDESADSQGAPSQSLDTGSSRLRPAREWHRQLGAGLGGEGWDG